MRCLRGRKERFAKPSYALKAYRGFESRPHRETKKQNASAKRKHFAFGSEANLFAAPTKTKNVARSAAFRLYVSAPPIPGSPQAIPLQEDHLTGFQIIIRAYNLNLTFVFHLFQDWAFLAYCFNSIQDILFRNIFHEISIGTCFIS